MYVIKTLLTPDDPPGENELTLTRKQRLVAYLDVSGFPVCKQIYRGGGRRGDLHS